MSKTFSTADVASHNKTTDLYIVVDEDVYDLTGFQDEHPGGKKSTCNKRFFVSIADSEQFFRESQAKMHRSNSGSITMKGY